MVRRSLECHSRDTHNVFCTVDQERCIACLTQSLTRRTIFAITHLCACSLCQATILLCKRIGAIKESDYAHLNVLVHVLWLIKQS